MIQLLVGTPGSGKSAVAVDMGLQHVIDGGVVVSNFSLIDDWFDVAAGRHICSRLSSSFRRRRAAMFRDRWWTFRNVDDLWRFCDIYPKYLSKRMRRQFEGRVLLIIDEAQLIFNSRNWQRNMPWIEFFSQHRKLGYDVILIAHDDQMIDTQCRSFVELIAHLRNLRHIRLPIPFVKIPLNWLFLTNNAIHVRWRYYGSSVLGGETFKNQLSRLTMWKLQLYDSLRLFRLGDSDSDADGLQRFGNDPELAHELAVQYLAENLRDLVSDLRQQKKSNSK